MASSSSNSNDVVLPVTMFQNNGRKRNRRKICFCFCIFITSLNVLLYWKARVGCKQQSQHLVYQSFHHRIICFTIKHITISNLDLAAKLITPSIKNQYKMAGADIFSRLQRNISKTSVDDDPSTQRDDKDNSDVPSPIRLSKSEDESSVEGNNDEDKPPTNSAKSNSDEDKPPTPMRKRRLGDRLARVGLRELGEKSGKNIKEGLTVAGENVKEGMTVAGENVKEGMTVAGENVKEGMTVAGENVKEGMTVAGENVKEGMTEAGEKAGNKVKEGLKEAGEKVGNKVKEGLKEAGEKASNKVKEGLKEAGEKVGNKVKEGLKEAGEKAGNKVKEGLKEGLKDMSITHNFSTNTLGLANTSLALAKKGLAIFLIVNFMWAGLFLIWLFLKLFKYL